MEHISFVVSDQEKKDFKSACAKSGDQMSTILRDCVTAYIASKNVKIIIA